jgi:hypothetical protein
MEERSLDSTFSDRAVIANYSQTPQYEEVAPDDIGEAAQAVPSSTDRGTERLLNLFQTDREKCINLTLGSRGDARWPTLSG